MGGSHTFIGEELADVYDRRSADVSFSEVIERFRPETDQSLADLIERDGHFRIIDKRRVTLERYIDAIGDLFVRPDPLDAAIDVTLRWMSQTNECDESVETLVARYPQLAEPIYEAAALNIALFSTTGLRTKMQGMVERNLPCAFGPKIADGRKRYELQKLLGSGAFGRVYQAVDRQLSEDGYKALVAIKILAKTDQTSWFRHRLAEEATKARRVEHPNVIRVLDRGVSDDDEDFIVYELVDGGDLAMWVREQRRPIAPRVAAQLMARICRGVQAAHAAGLVHCDLKPGNILLAAGSGRQHKGPDHAARTDSVDLSTVRDDINIWLEPKVADFGIAIRANESLVELRQNAATESTPIANSEQDFAASDARNASRLPLGNLAFISPEQFRMDDNALTVPSDVYALGGIFFLLLTGELPNGSSEQEIARVHHPVHGRTSPPSLRAHRSEIDPDLERICQRALSPKPSNRYSAAGAFADDIEAWLRYEPLYWTKPSAFRIARLWMKRRPAVAGITGVLLLTLFAGSIVTNVLHSRTVEARAEAEIEAVRRAEEETRRQAIITRIVQVTEDIREEDILLRSSPQMLFMFWVLQYMLGTNELRFDESTPEFWTMRFDYVQSLIERTRDSDRYTHLDTMLWRSTMSYWLIEQGDVEAARNKLLRLRADWEAVLDPSDRWIGYVDALLAVTLIKQAIVDETPVDAELRDRLRNAGNVLIAQEKELRADSPASPLHLLVLETQYILYGPDLLDQPERRQAAQRIQAWCEQFRFTGATRR